MRNAASSRRRPFAALRCVELRLEKRGLGRGRAFQATGLQVLFALLERPEPVAHPYRLIAGDAGVAHGTVGWVMAELPGLGYVATVGGRRLLINGERLLDRWTEAHARTLRPKLLLGRYRGDLGVHQRTTPWPGGVLIGGELAAARLTRHLRPGTATFYAEGIDPKVLRKLVLKPTPRATFTSGVASGTSRPKRRS